VNDAKQLADFMCYLNSNLAREVCRLADWGDKVWARRYRAIEVSDEPEAQRERMKYILSHGVKEFLVEKAREWPGVHVVRALLDDEPLQQKENVAELVREIEEEAAAQRAATGKSVLGCMAILKQNPHERPDRPKKSYAPLVHAASRKIRRELYEGYRAFVAAYREAAEKLRGGDRAVIFPTGSFPPALPFVGG
jgi:hypothetical protein